MRNVLLVGCCYTGEPIPDTHIDVLGLCRPSVDKARAAYALYEYDLIIINPLSYSHFIFGGPTKHSDSPSELWELKAESNQFDLDTIFDRYDRAQEMSAALEQGTRVIWLMAHEKRTKFFGVRSLYDGYLNNAPRSTMNAGLIYEKKTRRLTTSDQVDHFGPYFDQLRADGWSLCLDGHGPALEPFAFSPEGYVLGGRISVGEGGQGWLMTPPTTEAAANILVRCALDIQPSVTEPPAISRSPYHGIFLSHTSADKPFVRELKRRLEAHGVTDVWLDEAEILIGDSLIKKIDDGLRKTRYIAVVLSSRSIKSPWVERELEIALTREISSGEVVVLPILYEKCEVPSFLTGKLYADCTSAEEFDESIEKLLRRLKVSAG
ncbi:TIR domain-containing protein [Pseudomonas sp. NPDC008258]|uniref:toll/interleukin-1 receptor domain-containing protein n=1 Tax=Pseudomonas sp. NPDC008258 TaxID=3364418 RepID=UPI0036E49E78